MNTNTEKSILRKRLKLIASHPCMIELEDTIVEMVRNRMEINILFGKKSGTTLKHAVEYNFRFYSLVARDLGVVNKFAGNNYFFGRIAFDILYYYGNLNKKLSEVEFEYRGIKTKPEKVIQNILKMKNMLSVAERYMPIYNKIILDK